MVKCTIGIPIYNRAIGKLNFVALESALAQPTQDTEILVVDDCSTDGTWEILKKYSDPRLRLVRNNKNLGLFANFNRCLKLSEGKYLKILCSDDMLTYGTLNREVRIMEQHPKVAMLSTRGMRITPRGQILGLQADHFKPGVYRGAEAIHAFLWFQAHYAYNPLNYPSGVLFNKEFTSEAGWFDTSMKMAGDIDFYLRILEHGDLAVADFIGCYIGIHDHQAGAMLNGYTEIIEEIKGITDRYRALLERQGTHKEICSQLAAYSLGLAFKYWCMGMRDAASSHFKIARCIRVQPVAKLIAICKMFVLRFLLRTTGSRVLPARPCCPL